jgi:hypothetical protein
MITDAVELWVDSYSPYYAAVFHCNTVIYELTNWKSHGMADMFDRPGLQQWLRDAGVIDSTTIVV